MPLTPPLFKEAALYLSTEEMGEIRDAYELARKIYEREKYASDEPLIIHTEKIARLLLHLHPDARTIVTALLQYARTEDLRQIERRFGVRIVRTISALSVLERGSGRVSLYSPAYLRKMALALSEDIRVLLIWLHNCWHLLQHTSSSDAKYRRALAREVLDVFAPIAARLGVYSLKYTLETLAFSILYPEEAREIDAGLEKLRKEQGSFLSEETRSLRRLLLREGKRAEILSREKHPYSIFRKMQLKGVSSMTNLHDLFGLRILVQTEEDCYGILGVIHRTYRPILHRVKDYISFPKPNGYRSLHTTVLGLYEKDPSLPVEVQIRTRNMNEEAEFGIAAHWNYKDEKKEDIAQQSMWAERMRALRKISSASEKTEEALSDILSDRIYVLTPKGDPIELPKGSTPLDFAFRVHTDVGLCFRSAKVNGVIASIDQILENGDMIEILKQKIPRPSPQWIQIVRTGEARAKLRAFFRFDKVTTASENRQDEQRKWRRQNLPKSSPLPPKSKESLVELDTETYLPHRFAKCCNPKEGREKSIPIIGFITRTGMVNIHRRNCHMLQDANAERLLRANWSKRARTMLSVAGPSLSPPSSDT